MSEHLLVVEDEEPLRRNLVRFLEREGHTVTGYGSAEEALAAEGVEFSAAVLDLRLPGMDGISLARALAERSPSTAVIMMTAYSSVQSVVAALQMGVQDYLIKPVLLRDLGTKLERLLAHRRVVHENSLLRRQLAAAPRAPENMVARSAAMQSLLAFVQLAAPSAATVLIEGESGSGKELIARAIHSGSPRANEPFQAVNMAAIPENLVESQLFGHVRGAFTGAETARDGLFRSAGRGTLFLDEIGDLPLQQQAKLLRVLETREVVPVGSDTPVRTECRIVAATNTQLMEAVQQKRFRADLFYRLATLRVRVPALRERREDIPALVQHFIHMHAAEHNRPVIGIDSVALARLMSWNWPGNVRELAHCIERATLVSSGSMLLLADLPSEIAGAADSSGGGYHDAMEEFERALLAATLERCGGDRREAARILGLSLATLYRRIEKLNLKTPRTDSPRDPSSRESGKGALS